MTPAERIITKFGGLSKLAAALNHTHPSTVQGWRDRGLIPMRQVDAVMAAAEKAKIKLSLSEFFAGTPKPPARRRVRAS